MRRTSRRFTLALLSVLVAACASPVPASPPAPQTESPSATPPLPTFTPAPTPVPGGLYVDAAQDLGPINPYVYGSNYGPWLFIPLQMRSQAVAAKLTFMRFPGGNWGDLNDLDEWQIDQFIALCKELGSEPMINVRLKDGTPEKAAALVTYVNLTRKYNVRYWAIGNEPNLYGNGYDVARFNQEWRTWAEAMRAVDPSIVLVGPETNQFMAHPNNPDDQKAYDWLVEFLKANGDQVDVVSVHRYPFPLGKAGPPPKPDQLRTSSQEWDEIVPTLNTLIREHTNRDLPIAITEVNSSWAASSGGETTLDSHANAIWWGDVLGRMIRQGVDIVAQFAVIGEYGLMDNYDPYPIYFVYVMYQKFGEGRRYASSDDPSVSIFAAQRADGALTLMVVNRNAEPVDKTLTLDHFDRAGEAETWLFDKDHPAEQVEATPVDATTSLKLPAESMTLLIVP